MAGLPEHLDNLDEIDERVHQFYDKVDDGYRLTDISSLKNAKTREKEEKRRLKQALSDLEGRYNGLSEGDVEELIKLKENKKKEEIQRLEEKRQWEALRKQLEENFQNQLKEVKSEAKRNWELLESYVRKDHLQKALDERNVTTTGREIIPELVEKRVKLGLNDDGRPALQFYDNEGVHIMVNGKNEEYTLDDFMEEMFTKYDDLFLGANKSGTGARNTARHYAKMNKSPSNMSKQEKADFINSFGMEAWTRLVRQDIERKREIHDA